VLVEQLAAERLLYLEALADTDDDTEAIQFRVIAKYLKRLIKDLPVEIDARFQHFKDEDAGRIERLDTSQGGTPYMESDGDPVLATEETH
jgi:hypothetical protein